jgi:Calcineurin-like phosphoesterase
LIPRCTDAQFIALWKEHLSGTKVADALNIKVRNAMGRRRKIEERYGITLPVHDERRPQYTTYEIRHKARVNLKIKEAVLPIAGDVHIWPGERTTVQRAYIEMVKRLKPEYVILIGDVFDGARTSRHPRIGFLENRPTTKQEIDAVRSYLDELEAVAPKGAKLIWCLGNHDARYESYLASQVPEMEGVHGMHLKDHFPFWTPCWAVHINEGTPGHTVIKHRWHNGIHAAYNNALRSGTNMVTGHLHQLQATKWTDFTGSRYGVDTGVMADIDDPQFVHYTEDNSKNWTSGFGVITFRESRLMRPEFVQKWAESRVEFRGEVIEV